MKNGKNAIKTPADVVHAAEKLEVDQSHPQYIQTHIGVGYRMIQCNKDSET